MTNSEQICSELGKLYFFKELEKSDLVYIDEADNQEKELADIILRVGNYIFTIQIKEMDDTSKDIQKWLDKKVYRNAKNQTKETCKIGQTKNAGNFGCAWNEQYEFCSPTGLSYLSCGSKDSIAYDIPVMVPRLTSYAITALKTITPVILIIIGMFQLIKAISSQNEDEMKKARSALIKKLIAAAMIFFLVAIVQFIVKQVADKSEQSSTEACFDCFINNNCSNAMYYTDGYGKCYAVSNNSQIDCTVDKY